MSSPFEASDDGLLRRPLNRLPDERATFRVNSFQITRTARLRLAHQPTSLVVVSNDARLQGAARRRGAHAWTDQELLDHFDKGKQKSSEARATDVKQASVTPEESQRWLGEFKNLEADPELKEFFDQDRFDDE